MTNEIKCTILRPVKMNSRVDSKANLMGVGRSTAFLESKAFVGTKFVAACMLTKTIVNV